MRFLFLIQGKAVEDHPGYHDACLRLLGENVLSAYMPFCYFGEPAQRMHWRERWEALLHDARQFSPDVVLCQFFHGPIEETRFLMDGLRALPSRPAIGSSCGDPFVSGLSFHNFPKPLRESTRLADLSFFTQMGAGANAAGKWGAKNIVLWPNGLCQVRFSSRLDLSAWKPDFDLVFVGSHNAGRNPLSSVTRAARNRFKLVSLLSRRYGRRFGLFGRNWQGNSSWQGPVAYSDQVVTARRGRIVFGGYPHCTADYYTSDRFFMAVSSGVPLVDYRVPKVDRLLADGSAWYSYCSEVELIRICDLLLNMDKQDLMEQSDTAAALVHERHTQYHRMKFAIQTMGMLRAARLAGKRCEVPKIDFLLPGASQSGAIENWHG